MRPLNLGETLDSAAKIVAAQWRVLATVMIVVSLPIAVANVAIVLATTDTYEVGTSLADTSDTGTTYSDEGAYAAGQAIIALLTVVGYLLGVVACYRAIADTYLGRPTSAGESLRYAAGRLGAALWVTVLVVVCLIPAFVALIAPGIWLAVAWSMALPVLLVEGTAGTGAMRRSFALVKDMWWSTFGKLAVAYILVSIVGAIAAVLLLLPVLALVDDTSTVALAFEQLSSLLLSLLTTPFIAAVTVLVYFDLRVRKEGFDLEVLAERLGGDRAGPAPTTVSAGRLERDAFGHPATSIPPPIAPRPDAPQPGGWAPPSATPGPEDDPPPPPPPPSSGGWAPPVPPDRPRDPPEG